MPDHNNQPIEDKAVVRADAEPFRDAETKTLE
jgi:hypothetical protein